MLTYLGGQRAVALGAFGHGFEVIAPHESQGQEDRILEGPLPSLAGHLRHRHRRRGPQASGPISGWAPERPRIGDLPQPVQTGLGPTGAHLGHSDQGSPDDGPVVIADVGGQHDKEGAWSTGCRFERRLGENGGGNVLDGQVVGGSRQIPLVVPSDDWRSSLTNAFNECLVKSDAPTRPAFRREGSLGPVSGGEDQDITPRRLIVVNRFHSLVPDRPQALLGGRECSDGISRGAERVCGCTRRFERPGLGIQLAEHSGSSWCGYP